MPLPKFEKKIWDSRSRLALIEEGYKDLVVDRPENTDFISRITINRGDENFITNATRAALLEQLQINDQDPDVRCTIIRGNGDHFCGGFEVTPGNSPLPFFTEDSSDGQQARNMLQSIFMMHDMAKPIIGQVHGKCLGIGMELTAGFDVLIVSEDAQIGYDEVRGKSLGDVQIFPWLCGMRSSMDLMLTNKQMTGITAVERGFATECHPNEQLEEKTIAFASRVAKIPADLLTFNKRSVHRAFETMGIRTNLKNATDLETLMFKTPGARMLTARRGPPRRVAEKPGTTASHKQSNHGSKPSAVSSSPSSRSPSTSPTTTTTTTPATTTPRKTQPTHPAQSAQPTQQTSLERSSHQRNQPKPYNEDETATLQYSEDAEAAIEDSGADNEEGEGVHIHLHKAVDIRVNNGNGNETNLKSRL